MKHKSFLFLLVMVTSFSFIISACDAKEKPSTKTENDSVVDEKNKEATAQVELPDAPLQKWDEGADVEELQQMLKQLAYEQEASGDFDEYTTWAITDLQLQSDSIIPTGRYNEETKEFIQSAIDGDITVTPEEGIHLPSDAYLYEGNSETVENPYDILALVNKEHALPADYDPEDLVIPNVRYPFTEELPKKQLREIAADALEELFDGADQDELELFAQSGYRSYDRQDAIFASNVEQHGEEAANNFSARPGQSEHQSGLTMDVTSSEVNYDLVVEFGETPEGLWLTEHAHEYGFIIRYPEGKEDITQYQYEPWHLRYVGVKVATDLFEQGITFEEYMQQQ